MIKVLPHTTMLDAALLDGSLEAVFGVAFANGKSITDELVVGEMLQSSGLKFKPSVMAPIANPDKAQVSVMAGQTLLDLAVQELGSLEAVFALSLLNRLPTTAELTTSQMIDFSINPLNKKVAQTFKNNSWKPASATTSAPAGQPPLPVLEGVDYWAIEVDFKVQ